MTDIVARTVRDPEWLAHRYDPVHDAIHFIHVPREMHRRATFLTDEYLADAGAPVVLRRDDAIAATTSSAPIHFIFHSAFCCSTLLARAFDIPGISMGLKEPIIFNDIAGWRHRGGGKPADVARALDHASTLLARPFATGETVIVKPSNVVNGFATALLAMKPSAHALLLYAPLDIYLKSVAKKGMTGRLWVRELLVKQLRDGMVDLGFTQEDYLGLTDLQAAAVGWLAQHALFAQLVQQYPDRVRTLDSEALLAQPALAMSGLVKFFGLDLDDVAISRIVDGEAFKRHSKDGSAFGSDARSAEYRDTAALHGDEIAKVLAWAEAVAASANVAIQPGSTLI